MRTNVKLRLLSVLLAVVLCATMLTACGGSKLDGTYHSQGLISQSFTFDGDQVTMSAFGVNASGTYRIEGGSNHHHIFPVWTGIHLGAIFFAVGKCD